MRTILPDNFSSNFFTCTVYQNEMCVPGGWWHVPILNPQPIQPSVLTIKKCLFFSFYRFCFVLNRPFLLPLPL